MLVFARLLVNAVRLVTWPLWALFRRARMRKTHWVALRVRGPVVELESAKQALWRGLIRGLRPQPVAVAHVRELRRRMAEDPHVQGLLLYVGHVEGGWATLSSLREELALLRAAGKQIVAYLPVGASQREIYLASVADRVLAAPAASFSALGPMVGRAYFASLLRKLGVEVEVLAEGPYKTAAEPLVRSTMSEPEREQLTAIVSTLAEGWIARVGERQNLGKAGAQTLLETAYFGAARAQELGLVDGCHYEDELPDVLGFEGKTRPLGSAAYLRAAPRPLFLPLRPRPRVAIVRLEGVIGEMASGKRGVALNNATSCLRAVAEHPRIAGVVLYIDSPGGSAVVSDLLHREIKRLDAKKPVVAWLGNVAASGGYYLAAAARRIVASPSTLTGSIGVISARPTAVGLLDKLEVRQEIVKVTPHADIYSPTRELTDEERALLRGETRRFYERFLDVVAEGRKRPREQIEPLAGGRVWSGRDAHEHGLLDELGGYPEARAAVERELGERAAQLDPVPWVIELPKREVTPAAPARSALEALCAIEPDAEQVLQVWQICREGHVLACALDLVCASRAWA